MTTNSNIPLTYYTSTIYDTAQDIKTLRTILMGISCGLVILSLVCDKIIPVELFGVWQVAYFTLANVDKVNPFFYPLLDSTWSNGYDFV